MPPLRMPTTASSSAQAGTRRPLITESLAQVMVREQQELMSKLSVQKAAPADEVMRSAEPWEYAPMRRQAKPQ